MTPTHGLYGAPIAAGWQTILADLSLILFMVTAAALANAPDGPMAPMAPAPPKSVPPPQVRPRPPVAASPRAEPVGVWSDGPGVPPLADWLAQQGRDPRLRVTILVRHGPGRGRAALAQAEALVDAAGPRGAAARIVIEQGPGDSASVLLAYDAE
jgi:hypothetical protein